MAWQQVEVVSVYQRFLESIPNDDFHVYTHVPQRAGMILLSEYPVCHPRLYQRPSQNLFSVLSKDVISDWAGLNFLSLKKTIYIGYNSIVLLSDWVAIGHI